ncbi:zinc finger protein 2-like isoform X4 [Limulus polyphemus]|uniref:Zinc finger protein 2-like isoform X4 n=1 Tax=Limulus polyphemus TaxID=6850 RepID=A0ABM1SUB3_LIMPO|nr:zinc finger protein 2-like isoform X4 [Limulus polyphemus]
MEILKMKFEPFSDEEQEALLDIKLEKNEHESSTITSTTGKPDYMKETSLHTILKFEMIKEEKEDIYDGATEKNENIFVQEKIEHPGDLIGGNVISKFSESNDDDLDSLNYNDMNVKTKIEFQEEIEPVLESASEVLKMKVEPFSDEKQDAMINIKLEKNEDEAFTITGTTLTANYMEERSIHTLLKFGIIKEETEDNYDGATMKTENIFVQEKTEHPGDLLEDDVISKFSDNNDDVLDNSNYNDMDAKTKTEFQEEIKSVLESTSDMKTSVNMCCENQCPGYHVMKPEDHYTEVIKSSKPNNTICGETTVNGSNLKEFDIPQCNGKTYSCVVSGKEFRTMDNLTQEKRIQSGEKPYHCAAYGKDFERNGSLKQHERNHTGEKSYSCGICEKLFVSKYNLKIHQRIHTGEKPYSCEVCEKQFISKGELKKHQRIHTGEKPYSCTVCRKQFGTRGTLKLHQSIHSGEKPYSCMVCEKQFRTRNDLKIHQITHSSEKPYSCTVCGKNFGRKNNLKSHQIIHTEEKLYSCAVCAKKFKRNDELKKHQKTHISKKTYSCSVCQTHFWTMNSLKLHQRIHTEEKPHSCAVCGKHFFGSSNFEQHLRTHTEEKPSSCAVCGKQLGSKDELRSHLTTHIRVKPYSSDVCGERFLGSNNLRQHQRIHPRWKPHNCSFCGKYFKRTVELKVHQEIHTREEFNISVASIPRQSSMGDYNTTNWILIPVIDSTY